MMVKKTWRKRLTALINTDNRKSHASPDIMAVVERGRLGYWRRKGGEGFAHDLAEDEAVVELCHKLRSLRGGDLLGDEPGRERWLATDKKVGRRRNVATGREQELGEAVVLRLLGSLRR